MRLVGLLALSGLALVACQGFAAPGGFEDEQGDTDGLPPDLPQVECDPRRYDDCAEGSKCSFVIDTTKCVEVLGDGGEGEVCSVIGDSDSCANHLICWGADGDGQAGVCVDFCSTGLACTDPLAICSVSNAKTLFLCLPKCNPLIQDCDPGWGCYPDDNKRWACDRDQSAEFGAHGDPCGCLNCCDPGLVCMPGALVDAEGCGPEGDPGCCGEVCDLDDRSEPEDVCPTPNESCRAYYSSNMVFKGYERVGLCED